jgi:hypothetical protein
MQAALDGKKSVEAAMQAACEKVSAILADEQVLKESFTK